MTKPIRLLSILLVVITTLLAFADYDPQNPGEPNAVFSLTLETSPTEGGYFNIASKSYYKPNSLVKVSASPYSNYIFLRWETPDGKTVTTDNPYSFTINSNTTLVAVFEYSPNNPGEPVATNKWKLFLKADPDDSGYFNYSSGNSYEAGSQLNIRAYPYSNYSFESWTLDGKLLSENQELKFTMPAGNTELTAHFKYDPNNPSEPSSALHQHKLYLECDPAEAGYFNTSSGNTYKEGAEIRLRAYPYKYYTFSHWTADGVTIDGESDIRYQMPDRDVRLVAHFDYEYNPGNPSEPNVPTTKNCHLYGMYITAWPGETVMMPVYLENMSGITGASVDLTFPADYEVAWLDAHLSDRVASHTIESEDVGNNSYRFNIRGNEEIKGANGKLFEVPVTVPETATPGVSDTIRLSKGLVVNGDGSQSLVTVRNGIIKVTNQPETLPDSPDLVVTDVATTSTQVAPGEMIHVSWQVANQGNIAALGGWRERISLLDDKGRSVSIGNSYYTTSNFEVGEVAVRSCDIKLPALLGIEGPSKVSVTLIPESMAGEIKEYQANNTTTTADYPLSVDKQLYLKLPDYEIEEGVSNTVRCELQRSGSWTETETYDVSLEGDERVTAPKQIEIPRQQSATYFYLIIHDNATLDADSTFTVGVSGNGYKAVTASFTVKDNELPAIQLTAPSDTINEGESLTLGVKLQHPSAEPITLSIGSDLVSRFEYPSILTIEPGATECSFVIRAIDNDEVEMPVDVHFSVSAIGYSKGECKLTLADNDVPTIALALTPQTVSEGAGATAVIGTITRLDNTDKKVTILLSDDSDGELFFSTETLEMPVGVVSRQFTIGIVDNDAVDGERSININAAVFASSCSCAMQSGSRGIVTAALTVTDDDGPTLKLTSSSSAMLEGSSNNILTVTRNTDSSKPLTLTVTSDYDEMLEYNHQVTIPANAKSTTVQVTVKNNDVQGDSPIVSFKAEAEGFATGTCWVQITDATLPDAVITDIETERLKVYAGDSIDVNITIRNDGVSPLPAQTPVSLYLNSDSNPIKLYTQQQLKPGEKLTLTRTVELPLVTGAYWIKAIVNESNKVKELVYANNVSQQLILVLYPAYTASARPENSLYKSGETVKITGSAEGKIAEGGYVEVYVLNDGTRQSFYPQIDANGHFTVDYTPYTGQMGRFYVGACFPGDKSVNKDNWFDIIGLQMPSKWSTVEIEAAQTYEGYITITNPGVLSVNNIKAIYTGENSGCRLSVEAPETLEGGKSADVKFTIEALTPTEGSEWLNMPIEIVADGDISLPYSIYYFIHNPNASLSLSETRLKTSVKKGSQRDIPVTIYNTGKAETGKVTVSIPNAPWLRLATPQEMPSIPVGGETTMILRLIGSETLQLNNQVSAIIAVNCENGDGITLPLTVEAVSDEKGTLTLDVCDEYTYYTEEAPHLQGATVTVMHPVTRAIIAQDETDQRGICSFTLTEGYWYVTVTKDDHSSYANNLMVSPGIDSYKVVNLGINGIKIDIHYESTEIADEYNIVTTVKYETNIPVPVVETILPEKIEIEQLEPGESMLFDAVLINHGLVTAKNTNASISEAPGEYRFTLLGQDRFDLLPSQSVTIPVKVTHMADSGNAPMKAKDSSGDCSIRWLTVYTSECGDDGQIHTTEHRIPYKVCKSNGGGGGGGSSVGGGGWGGGGWWYSGPSWSPSYHGNNNTTTVVTKPDDIVSHSDFNVCDPCTNGFMKKLAKCNDFDPDHPIQSMLQRIPIVGDALGCGFSLYNDYKEGASRGQWGYDIFKCALKACEAIGGTLVALAPGAVASGVGAGAGAAMAVGGKAMEAVCKVLDDGSDAGECLKDLLTPCPESQKSKAMRAPSTGAYPSYIEQYQEKLAIYVDGFDALRDYVHHLLGSDEFYESDLAEVEALFAQLQTAEDAYGLIDITKVSAYKPANVTEAGFEAFIERLNNTARKSQGMAVDSDNYIDDAVVNDCLDRVKECNEKAKSLGYLDVESMMEDAYLQLVTGFDNERNSICASVTLRLSQTMTMTRQAIRGTLTIFNGHETDAMTDISVKLTAIDPEGNIAGSSIMQITPESLSGFNGSKDQLSGWSLAAGKEGEATILFIPTKYAAPTEPRDFTFVGSVTYIDPFTSLEVTRELTPATIQVNPSPNLDLVYFMQRDIYGDDPLTAEVVEKSKPAEFALLIKNQGYGDAKNVCLVTRQPEIIENQKGLLIDFELLGSSLNGSETTLAWGENIATDFGTIPAHTNAYAQWWLKSSLLGHFTEYDVKATHVNSYDNPDLSLLGDVSIHELIKGFTPTVGSTQRAFLVNDIADVDDMPDRLYFTDGSDEQGVMMAQSATMSTDGKNRYLVEVTPTGAGWHYATAAALDGADREVVSITRLSDGQQLATDNFWFTDRTLRDGREPVYENLLHLIVEINKTERYLVELSEVPDARLYVEQFVDVPDPNYAISTALQSVGIVFNKQIDGSTFTVADLSLTCQGRKVNLSGAKLESDDNQTWRLDFGGCTSQGGYYVLTVRTSEIIDYEGFRGENGYSVSWAQYPDGLVNIEVKASPAECGSVNPQSGAYDMNQALTLTATPAAGYSFIGWTHNGEIISTEAELSVKPTEGDVFTANFTPIYHKVTILYDSTEGYVEGAATGLYNWGSELSLRAIAADGYEFGGWYDAEGSVISSDPEITVTISDDMVIRAMFSLTDSALALSNAGISIYPMPLKSTMYVRGDFYTLQSLRIFDMSGRLRFTKHGIEPHSAINISMLPPGVYFVRIETDCGIFIRKVVKI